MEAPEYDWDGADWFLSRTTPWGVCVCGGVLLHSSKGSGVQARQPPESQLSQRKEVSSSLRRTQRRACPPGSSSKSCTAPLLVRMGTGRSGDGLEPQV